MLFRRHLALPGALALALASCTQGPIATSSAAPAPIAATAANPLVVYLVRHAERGTAPAGDPSLTPAGASRALALRDALRDAGVRTIVTSDRRRTQETAQPLATALGLAFVPVGVGGAVDAHVAAVAREVRARGAAGAVLVVGHSNTIPAIIRALGGPAMSDICDGMYADLFVLTADAGGGARLVRASYGAASDATGCAAMTAR